MRPHMHDGNYVVASHHKRPWQKQLTMLAGYLYFYNPIWLAVALMRAKTRVSMKPAGYQSHAVGESQAAKYQEGDSAFRS